MQLVENWHRPSHWKLPQSLGRVKMSMLNAVLSWWRGAESSGQDGEEGAQRGAWHAHTGFTLR